MATTDTGAVTTIQTTAPIAVVTGASSGIGAATARHLAKAGFHVVLGARRRDRLDSLTEEIDGTAVTLDVTDQDSVNALAQSLPSCQVLVNNAGMALGLDRIDQADISDWQRMYDVNVLGAVRMTKALLPALEASGQGHVVVVTSTAGHSPYEGGGGYVAAKHAEVALAKTLRLELLGTPIRVSEIAPGMVHTEEFSLVRFRGDQNRADAVYKGVDRPLKAEDIAECIVWILTRPPHVDIDSMVVRPTSFLGAPKAEKR